MAISFELDDKTEQRLRKLAMRSGRSLDAHLQELIAQSIDDLEDLYLAEETMQRVTSGKEPVYSSEQVRKNLGLAD
ncbi:TraY domain-containing protein [Duganella sp. FT134W]|uniref:Relaxosome protein TraY n=1 Tax=Duganella margarita TaxID=2692170 RepID=A0A7X4H2U5_9BURK|nr:TraY domain-containing protein [Duganella margarita]MYM74322.1 TraY domain-containing protein [Duganella margarita]